jgi:AcrR family transcriptional regulator
MVTLLIFYKSNDFKKGGILSRDKETTKQRLIDAVGSIIREKGFQGIGINAVAREAGVDKVLIYRYFGDLDGLLRAFIAQKDYFSNLEHFLGENRTIESRADAIEMGKKVLIGQLRQALSNKELQEILLWELNQKNQVTDAVAETRERQAVAMLEEMKTIVDFDKVDFPAIGSLIVGGIYYLILRSRLVKTYSGIDLNSEEGWQRIEQAIIDLLDLIARDA